MSETRASVSVVVPTFLRPLHLRRCLQGIARQTRAPEEVVVVRQTYDEETLDVLRDFRSQSLVEATVDEPSVISAMRAGLAAASGEIIAFTDDDAVPRPDWLERLVGCFADPGVGAAGGRDVWVTEEAATAALTTDVGRITQWGKLIGNHHLGTGPARDVSVVKGCNSAFRRAALAVPRSLRGEGAQPHHEVATCLWARRRGWRIVYDPEILVDHFRAPRHDGRRHPRRKAIMDRSYNLVAGMTSLAPELRRRRALYGILVGDRGAPGLTRAAAGLVRGELGVVRALRPSLAGQLAALRDVARGRRVEMVAVDQLQGRAGPRKPRVALVAHDVDDQGGMERVFAELIRRGSENVDFVVVAGRLAVSLRGLVDWRRIAVPQRPFPVKFAAFFLRASRALRTIDADLTQTMGAIVANDVDIAAVHFCHAGFREATGSLAAPGTPLARRVNTGVTRLLALAAERWSYRPNRARTLATVSRGMASELERHYPGVRVAVTPNGIDVDRFSPDPAERKRVRIEEGVKPSEVVVLFVGGDWNRKGLDIAIEGLACALDEERSLRLWVVGRGDERRLRLLTRQRGIEEFVTFFGPRQDTERFFRAADLFLLPTQYESFSLAAYEAAACGLPVVGCRVNGVEDLVADGAGLLVDRTADAVGHALVRLAPDRELRRLMGAKARRRALEYTWERSIDSVLELYRSLIEEAQSPTGSRAAV